MIFNVVFDVGFNSDIKRITKGNLRVIPFKNLSLSGETPIGSEIMLIGNFIMDRKDNLREGYYGERAKGLVSLSHGFLKIESIRIHRWVILFPVGDNKIGTKYRSCGFLIIPAFGFFL